MNESCNNLLPLLSLHFFTSAREQSHLTIVVAIFVSTPNLIAMHSAVSNPIQ